MILAQYPTETAENLAVYPGKLIEGRRGPGGVLGVAAPAQRRAKCSGGKELGELAPGQAQGDAPSAEQPDVQDDRSASCHAMIGSTVCLGLFMSRSCVMVIVRPAGA